TLVVQRIASRFYEQVVQELVEAHAVETGSVLAEELLRDWPETVGRFWQAVPKEMLSRLHHPLDDNARAMPAE
ncbi:MAG: hypothetical protein AAFQ75_11670, partial [Pseudomonadota bacterium]